MPLTLSPKKLFTKYKDTKLDALVSSQQQPLKSQDPKSPASTPKVPISEHHQHHNVESSTTHQQEYHGYVHSPKSDSQPKQMSSPTSPPHINRPSSPLANPPTTAEELNAESMSRPWKIRRNVSASSLNSPVCYMHMIDDFNELPPEEDIDSPSITPESIPNLNTTNVVPSEESRFSSSSSGDASDTIGGVAYARSETQTPISHRRNLSEKIKSTPPSFVRQSRIFTGENGSSNSLSVSLSGRSVLLQNKQQIEMLPNEFHPILNLIHAQKLRGYCIGSFEIAESDKPWILVDAKLTGNELSIHQIESEDDFKPKYINLIDCQLELIDELQVRIYQDFQEESSLLIRFPNQDEFNKWMSAILLCKFEYVKLNEAFTAVVLSSKAPKLLDVHVLLSLKKRYPKYEWCNIRLPQVSSKWNKVFLIILPSDKNHLGRIEIYLTDKKLNKKNMIAYVSSSDHIYNVYPEQANMIDFNSIMNIRGEIYINKNYEHLFSYNPDSVSPPAIEETLSSPTPKPINKSSSFTSLTGTPLLSIPRASSPLTTNHHQHTRTSSINSTNSFFTNATASPRATPSSPPTTAATGGRFRSHSNASNTSSGSSSSFFKKKKLAQDFVITNSMYIMPISHPGVSAIETMIRNFIPMIDAFKLYGRPRFLNSDKTDMESLLFGMPSLPHYQYLSRLEAGECFAKLSGGVGDEDGLNDERWQRVFGERIGELQKKSGGGSGEGRGYRGYGDISKLYNNLDISFDDISSPIIAMPANNSGSSGSRSGSGSELDVNGLGVGLDFGEKFGGELIEGTPMSR